MTNSQRTFVVALAVITVVACDKNNNVARPTVDVLAQDTTLQLAPVRADQETGPQDILAVVSAPTGAPIVAPNTTPVRSAPTARSLRASQRRARVRRPLQIASSERLAGRSKRSRTNASTTAETVTRVDQSRVTLSPRVESAPPVVQEDRSRRSTVASGSQLALATQPRICTNSSNVGDRFETVLIEPVAGTNGTSIPKGATAVARVSSVAKEGSIGDDFGIGLQIESITFNGRTYPVSSDVTYAKFDKVRSGSRASSASRVAAGGILGGALGQVLGRNTRSTVIGAAGGAAAGAILASRTTTFNSCVPSGGRITAYLTQPLIIETSA